MPRLCSVCCHPQRHDIDADLLRHVLSYRAIARRYEVQDDALMRHEHTHLRMSWQHSKELAAMLSADHLLDKLRDLDSVTLEILTQARDGGDLRTALAAVRESRGNVEVYARLGVMSDLEHRVALLEAPDANHEGHADGDTYGD